MTLMDRRTFLKLGLASTLALRGLPTAARTESNPVGINGPLRLPPWKFGTRSFSTETILMFRGNPSHTFYGTGPLPECPRLHWVRDLDHFPTTLAGQPITWSGTGWTGQASKLGDWIFVGAVDSHLYALSAATGQIGWKFKGGRMFKSSLCVFENRLYEGNTDNFLHCVDAATGREIWKFDSDNDMDASPCVVDGRLYAAGESGYARCLDARTGRLIWKTLLGGIGPGTLPGANGAESSPAIADGDYYAATYDGELVCLDARDGSLRWKAKTHDDTDVSPVVAGDFVYTAAEERASFLYCFDRRDGREIWRYGGNDKGYWSTPAVARDRVYIGGHDARLHCVDATTGAPIWCTRVGLSIWSSPCVVDDRVVFGSYDHHLYMLDADTGHVTWKQELDGRCISTPCIVDGCIYVGTATGRFYCFGK